MATDGVGCLASNGPVAVQEGECATKTIVCDKPGSLLPVERPEPIPGIGEVLVRIRRVGVCGTDMHIFGGKHPFLEYPRVMGHELSGEVADANGSTRLRAGQPVYINPYLSCGTCHACRRGKPNCCMRIRVLGVHVDGGLAEFLAVPDGNVFPAEGISLDQAAMVEFLAIGAHAVRRSGVGPNDRVLVIGAGPIGLGVVASVTSRGIDPAVLDLRPDRLAFCSTTFGLTHAVAAGEGAAGALGEITGGDFFDVVIDATGNAPSIERGFGFVAHGGTYVLVSVVKDTISFADPEFHKREMSLLGSRNALAEDFAESVAGLRDGRIPSAALNTHRGALADLPELMPRWIDPASGVVKALVEV